MEGCDAKRLAALASLGAPQTGAARQRRRGGRNGVWSERIPGHSALVGFFVLPDIKRRTILRRDTMNCCEGDAKECHADLSRALRRQLSGDPGSWDWDWPGRSLLSKGSSSAGQFFGSSAVVIEQPGRGGATPRSPTGMGPGDLGRLIHPEPSLRATPQGQYVVKDMRDEDQRDGKWTELAVAP
ncbi:hypothetical protein VTI74DRAFT_489 [Chaetomium olivicolor]